MLAEKLLQGIKADTSEVGSDQAMAWLEQRFVMKVLHYLHLRSTKTVRREAIGGVAIDRTAPEAATDLYTIAEAQLIDSKGAGR